MKRVVFAVLLAAVLGAHVAPAVAQGPQSLPQAYQAYVAARGAACYQYNTYVTARPGTARARSALNGYNYYSARMYYAAITYNNLVARNPSGPGYYGLPYSLAYTPDCTR